MLFVNITILAVTGMVGNHCWPMCVLTKLATTMTIAIIPTTNIVNTPTIMTSAMTAVIPMMMPTNAMATMTMPAKRTMISGERGRRPSSFLALCVCAYVTCVGFLLPSS